MFIGIATVCFSGKNNVLMLKIITWLFEIALLNSIISSLLVPSAPALISKSAVN